MSKTATVAPSATNKPAVAAPMPDAAPVTIATRPSSLIFEVERKLLHRGAAFATVDTHGDIVGRPDLAPHHRERDDPVLTRYRSRARHTTEILPVLGQGRAARRNLSAGHAHATQLAVDV